MPKVMMYKTDGTQVGEVALAENVFGAQVNEYAIHEMIVAQLANLRQGTQSALTRSEVRGGGIKPWRQKGTGRARQGSTLVVTAGKDEDVLRASNNIPTVKTIQTGEINVYDLVNCDKVIFTEAAVKEVEEVYA